MPQIIEIPGKGTYRVLEESGDRLVLEKFTPMTREQALEALDRAQTPEEIGAVIRAYGGLPVDVHRGWEKALPLPSLFGR